MRYMRGESADAHRASRCSCCRRWHRHDREPRSVHGQAVQGRRGRAHERLRQHAQRRSEEDVTPERALADLLKNTNEEAAGVRRCVKVELYQYEFDTYVLLAHNVGRGAFCKSSDDPSPTPGRPDQRAPLPGRVRSPPRVQQDQEPEDRPARSERRPGERARARTAALPRKGRGAVIGTRHAHRSAARARDPRERVLRRHARTRPRCGRPRKPSACRTSAIAPTRRSAAARRRAAPTRPSCSRSASPTSNSKEPSMRTSAHTDPSRAPRGGTCRGRERSTRPGRAKPTDAKFLLAAMFSHSWGCLDVELGPPPARRPCRCLRTC
jgi:hypothetical protein